MTRRLPKVVMTMQTAMLTAMRTVRIMPKGAGQQAGPQSWTVTPSPGLEELPHTGPRLEFQVPATQSGASSVLVTVFRADTEVVIRLAAEAVVVSRRDRQISWYRPSAAEQRWRHCALSWGSGEGHNLLSFLEQNTELHQNNNQIIIFHSSYITNLLLNTAFPFGLQRKI